MWKRIGAAAAAAAICLSLGTVSSARADIGGYPPVNVSCGDQPPTHTRTERTTGDGADLLTVRHARYLCVFGSWFQTARWAGQWATYGPDNGCKVYARHLRRHHPRWGTWHLSGHYESC